jgi:hypothetical protein
LGHPEKHESHARDGQSDQHHRPGPNPVRQVTLSRPHDPAFYPGQGQRQAQLGAGPAELPFQHHRPYGHGVEYRDGCDNHHEAADGNQVPAVENSPAGLLGDLRDDRHEHEQEPEGKEYEAGDSHAASPCVPGLAKPMAASPVLLLFKRFIADYDNKEFTTSRTSRCNKSVSLSL